ncbi:MAG: GTPase HflX [Fimbriimonadaceae bacterium]|nr:GTPase HflX [Fimbriimonadaceae bacterium]
MSKTRNTTELDQWKVQETAFLVYVNDSEAEDDLVEAELESLCEAAHIQPLGSMRQRVDKPHQHAYIGKGKLEELRAYVKDAGADVIVFDCELSGVQARNISEACETKVVDRTQLILDIFARRAKTTEGQLQVELAQLSYMMPRLMSVYTKFERQRGGIGMRGPGETKLEADRQMVRDRISKLRHAIDDVKEHRKQQRNARRKHPFPFVSIIGYTSAGKSTLMNHLSRTDVLVDAMVFATLDPTTRKVDLPDGYSIFLTDTVGFIRNLPTNLVAAFRATLEEAADADFILHVVDVSHPYWEEQAASVQETVDQLGAAETPVVTVFNKIDALEDPTVLRDLIAHTPNSVAISALKQQGIGDLMARLKQMAQQQLGRVSAILPYDKSNLVDDCYRFGRVITASYEEDGIHLVAEVTPELQGLLQPYSQQVKSPP